MISWIFAIATAVLLVLYNFSLALPTVFGPDTTRVILFVLVFCSSLLCARWASVLVASAALRGRKNLSQLLFLVIGVLVFLPALAADLHFVLNVDLAALLTTSAIATAVIGFALQSTLSNLFEGLAIQLHRPFKLGDIVVYDGVIGVIEDLSWRALRIRQMDGQALIVPNNALARGPIKVLTHGDALRIFAAFAAPADVEPRKVLRAVETAVSQLNGVLPRPAPQYLVKSFSANAPVINYGVEVSIDVTRDDRNEMKSLLYERIWYAFARENIPFGFVAMEENLEIPPPRFVAQRLHLNPERSDRAAREFAERSILSRLSDDSRSQILASARLLMFAPDEKVPFTSSNRPAGIIVVSGDIDMPLGRDAGALPVSTGLQTWPPFVIDRVTDHFREAIGPAAPYIVSSVATHINDIHALYQRLAEHISEERVREAFLAKRSYRRTVSKRPGSTIGFTTVLTGNTPSSREALCRSESTILYVDGETLSQCVQSNPEDVPAFAAIVSWECETAGAPRLAREVEEDIRRPFALR
jgi:small-conductance mechanosensitive channel